MDYSTTREVDDRKTNDQTNLENSENVVASEQSFNSDDIEIIDVDSPRHDNSRTDIETHDKKASGFAENVSSGAGESYSKTVGIIDDKKTASYSFTTEGQSDLLSKESSSTLIEDEQISGNVVMNTKKESTVVDNSHGNSNASSVILCTESISNGSNQNNKKATPITSESDTHLNQAAIKLLQRLEFKNPGRKQIEYGLFNPEESEREKKKLRRFQTTKPRTGVCYKENGMLLDGRDVCDCLAETCPGCFYPCPQCSSKKCGPTCRGNRKWVYDYIEDEGRTYRVEFPEQMNF